MAQSAQNAQKREKLWCGVGVVGGGRDALFQVAVVVVISALHDAVFQQAQTV